jgi:thioesterase domain-containing protein
LEETASLYINEIRKIVPDGPFQLIGFSSGGIMAFEMARQLYAMKLEVPFLGMLDTFCPTDLNKKMNVLTTDTLWRALNNLPFWLYYCAPFWLNHYAKKIIHRDVFKDESVNKVIELLHNYTPGYYKGRLVFFRSRAQAMFPATAHTSWSKLAEKIDVHTVPGHHISILKGSAVSALAKKINMELYESLKTYII